MLQGPVELIASDAASGQPSLRLEGVLFSLLGTSDPDTLEAWFAGLSDGGVDIDPLQKRPWGDHDGQVTDRFGVRWLIGYQG
jgi:PhnB protein